MADDGGIGRLTQRLTAIPRSVKEAVHPALIKQGEMIAGTMRQLVPVDTGELKDSITVTPPDSSTPPYSAPGGSFIVPETSVAVTVGGEDAKHAHLVEFGTVKMPAQPFFQPAIRMTKKKAIRNLKSAVSRAVKKNWGK
jgi:HK97 gp10 family phage protein